ncbi:M48 family metallopeptidase [Sphingorhabdus arenilitoris]|uniref:M48 family metallopeptidase n=1 Tax=Sphingorhabdus arenilitoris TaxID=1490041 RepID=A0ABV8RKV4_9SPHN
MMLDRLKTILSNSPSDGDPVACIEGENIPVRILRNPRAKRLSMRADAVAREIRITMPSYAPTSAAMEFVAAKAEWIAARMQSAPGAAPLLPGHMVAVEGEECRICWQADWPRRPVRCDGEIRLGGPQDLIQARLLRWLKEHARRVYTDEIAHYCGIAGEAPLKLQLGDPRSRWGSCSSRGTISLSWRLIMAPAHVRRSVIAHEVAHIRHMNHSPAFYAWMDEIYEGDRKAADRWLKMHGTGLQRVGR